jgi:hypothetical protein
MKMKTKMKNEDDENQDEIKMETQRMPGSDAREHDDDAF